ncbi:MAG: FAD-binding oxidoreductase [Gammaproteobacteria bacterium]|nr:FAD-binding oxidoreductase [Gammaproteobacteria bacterium]
MEISGWGRHPQVDAQVDELSGQSGLARILDESRGNAQLIARGAGRSYGDSSLSQRIVSSRFLDNFIEFDAEQGVISCAAGATLEQVLDICVPRGWLVPVLPGTRYVTVGGAIASDVHGKNHHRDGCFSNFVQAMTLMLASGEIVTCSAETNNHLFEATCGGMGLTGIILDAKLRLERITSAYIQQHTLPAANLAEIFDLFEAHAGQKYSVAWIDCLAKGPRRGRAVLFTGEQADYGDLENRDRAKITAPPVFPASLINRFSIGAFNRLYYSMQKLGRSPDLQHYTNYFFPLDWINGWNRLYGQSGFLQYQFVVPQDSAKATIDAVLTEISEQGKGSFLSVLKKMGPENSNLLSFPLEGYTLALDFKVEHSLFPLLDKLDQMVVESGGRVYLTKDARMSEDTFIKSYPKLDQFKIVRAEIDPDNLFGSLQSRRLGLSD